jgi:hypothetical protein
LAPFERDFDLGAGEDREDSDSEADEEEEDCSEGEAALPDRLWRSTLRTPASSSDASDMRPFFFPFDAFFDFRLLDTSSGDGLRCALEDARALDPPFLSDLVRLFFLVLFLSRLEWL